MSHTFKKLNQCTFVMQCNVLQKDINKWSGEHIKDSKGIKSPGKRDSLQRMNTFS
jgi:hypothetical protein